MEHEQLKSTLGELHAELSAGASVDPETRELLQQLARDINSLLEKAAEQRAAQQRAAGQQATDQRGAVSSAEPDPRGIPGQGDHAGEKQTLLDRMLDLTSEFEESHPRLAATIGRVADALSRMGI